jgi:hypothetical protein
VAQPVHERTLNREDALLPARRRRRDMPRLPHERMVESSEVDLDGRRLDLQILAQRAKRHTGSTCWFA